MEERIKMAITSCMSSVSDYDKIFKKKDKKMAGKSECCEAPVRPSDDEDEEYYNECTKCKKGCATINDKAKK
jgi:hypothetical protein